MPPQPKFKKGDLLNWVHPKIPSCTLDHWQNCSVTQVETDCSYGRIGYYVRSPAGKHGLLYESEVELVTPDLTPQELADKYRALRAEAQAISKQLQDMGFEPQIKYGTYDWTRMSINRGDMYRFTKTETTTTTL